jgi:hypothetical protein
MRLQVGSQFLLLKHPGQGKDPDRQCSIQRRALLGNEGAPTAVLSLNVNEGSIIRPTRGSLTS